MIKAVGTASGNIRKAGRMTVSTGMVNNKLYRWSRNKDLMSLVIKRTMMKTRKAEISTEMLRMLVTGIRVPYHREVMGQNSWMPPAPVNKSPNIECCIKEAKTGAADFLYFTRIGMNNSVCTTSEWVGPRWVIPRKKSTSGITDAKKSRGMLIFTCKTLEAAFPIRYPKAKCPTANMALSSVGE